MRAYNEEEIVRAFFYATCVNNPICSDRLNTMALFPRIFEIIHISAFFDCAPVYTRYCVISRPLHYYFFFSTPHSLAPERITKPKLKTEWIKTVTYCARIRFKRGSSLYMYEIIIRSSDKKTRISR